MKKIYLSLLTAITISGLATSQAKADIYLHNNYGAIIEYANFQSSTAYAKDPYAAAMVNTKSLGLGHGNRVRLNVAASAREMMQQIPTGAPAWYLFIRKVNGNFADITGRLIQAMEEQKYHSGNNAIIYIEPTAYSDMPFGRWTTRIEWEKSGNVPMTESTVGK